jgi:Sec-independent protein translocase protein TatA
MDFMGIGPLEIILILLLGFLFFGPEKLPGMAAKAGKWYRNFTRAANNFTKTLNEEIEQEKNLGKAVIEDVKSAIETPNEINLDKTVTEDVKSAIETPQELSEKPDNNTRNETDNNLNG